MPIPVDFCFRIEKEAELAYDKTTGEPAPAYARVRMELEREPKDYDLEHVIVSGIIASQFNIPSKYVTPISLEEYIAHAGDDEWEE